MSLTFLYLRDKAEMLNVDIGMVGAIKNFNFPDSPAISEMRYLFPRDGS